MKEKTELKCYWNVIKNKWKVIKNKWNVIDNKWNVIERNVNKKWNVIDNKWNVKEITNEMLLITNENKKQKMLYCWEINTEVKCYW